MSEYIARCEQCGTIGGGDLEAAGDALEDHEQFHDVRIERVATDGGQVDGWRCENCGSRAQAKGEPESCIICGDGDFQRVATDGGENVCDACGEPLGGKSLAQHKGRSCPGANVDIDKVLLTDGGQAVKQGSGVEPMRCPDCETDEDTDRLSISSNFDGTRTETWECVECDLLYLVEFEAVEKRSTDADTEHSGGDVDAE